MKWVRQGIAFQNKTKYSVICDEKSLSNSNLLNRKKNKNKINK